MKETHILGSFIYAKPKLKKQKNGKDYNNKTAEKSKWEVKAKVVSNTKISSSAKEVMELSDCE